MAEEMTGVTPEEIDETAEKAVILEALRKERDAHKQTKAQVKNIAEDVNAQWQLRTKHNLDEESWALVKDLPADKREAVAARLAPGIQPPTEVSPALPEEAALAAAQGLGQGAATPVQKYTFAEAKAAGGWSNPEIRKAAAEGRVEGISVP